MKTFKSMAFFAIVMPLMLSCSGGGSTSDSTLFGPLPEYFEQISAEQTKLKEDAKNIKSEAEKAELIKKSEEMKEKWGAKIEESAKALNGKPVEFAESNIKVTAPVSLEFDGFFSKSDMTPKFNVNGSAEAASEINAGVDYVLPKEKVYVVGYNAEGQQVYKIDVGSIAVENVDGKAIVKAGTPVVFSSFHMSDSKAAEYKAAKTVKLEVLR